MNNKYDYLLAMNRCALFAVMVVVSYGLCAQTPSKSSLVDLFSSTLMCNAEFKESALHPYGFDDYTNWNPQTAYYPHKFGKCDLPYISVKMLQTGYANLSLSPSPVLPGLDITVTDDKITNYQSSVNISSTMSFNATYYPGKYDSKMTASFLSYPMAEMMIKCYPEKEITVRLVRVNGATGVPDFSSLEKQAIIKILSHSETYNYPNINPVNNNTVWDLDMLMELLISFNPDYENTTENVYTMFVINGTMNIDDESPVGCTIAELHISWVLSSEISTRTAPHELGHCLRLIDKNNDKNALMCQSRFASETNADKLRKSEWEIIHQ